MDNTMDRIHQLSDERQQLWRQAGRRELAENEYWRLQQITRKLTKLWDSRRRHRAAVAWNGHLQETKSRSKDGELLAKAA